MDRKLKERLIGLIVLLTAAIIILPMVLGGPDEESERTVRLDRDRSSENLPVTRLDLREPDNDRDRDWDGGRREDSGRDRGSDRDDSTVAEAPVVQPFEPAEETRDREEPEPREDERQSDPDETEEATEEPEQAAAGVPEGSGWSAQVGSFSNRDNAEGLTQQLRGEGFDAFLMRHERGGSTFYRVRVGLEPEREDAERIARRVKDRTGHEASPVPHP